LEEKKRLFIRADTPVFVAKGLSYIEVFFWRGTFNSIYQPVINLCAAIGNIP
jgi:hypothetical protein